MVTVVDEYTEVINRLHAEETNVSGEERRTMGYVADGIARFLRGCPCGNPTDRLALLALAERAEEVSLRCFASPHPTGKA